MPLVVAGLARTFEATIDVQLREAPGNGEPSGTGDPVSAWFRGGVGGEQGGSSYADNASESMTAWGEFTFSIDGLDRGVYELFVGEFDLETVEPIGIYQRFTVGATDSPPQVTGVVAAQGGGSGEIIVGWDDVCSAASSYVVYHSELPGGPYDISHRCFPTKRQVSSVRAGSASSTTRGPW